MTISNRVRKKATGKERRRCAFSDVRAHTARTADRNVTLSQEVSRRPRRLERVRVEVACPSFNESHRCVCARGREVSSLSAKRKKKYRAARNSFPFVYRQFRDALGISKEMQLPRRNRSFRTKVASFVLLNRTRYVIAIDKTIVFIIQAAGSQ